jgi:GDPmannose 4,6-dehydratase
MMHGVWLMMQYSKPDNYVLASGEEHSVREFVELSFKEINVEIEWRGSGSNERGYSKTSGELLVEVNPNYYRPIDIAHLVGDASKARTVLGWKPEVGFKELVKLMTQHQINQFA